LAQIVDPDISDAKVAKLGHGPSDLLTLPHPDDPDTQRNAAPEGFTDIGEGLVVTATSGYGIVLISARRVVAGGQTDSRLLEGFPQCRCDTHEIAEDLDTDPDLESVADELS